MAFLIIGDAEAFGVRSKLNSKWNVIIKNNLKEAREKLHDLGAAVVLADTRDQAVDSLRGPWKLFTLDNSSGTSDLNIDIWGRSEGDLSGLKYWAIERPNRVKRDVRENVQHIITSCGYSDPLGITALAAQVLKGFYSDRCISITCIVTERYNAGQLEALEKIEQISVLKNLDDVRKEMLKADIAITTGGSTLLEALSVGVATITIPTGLNNDRLAQHLSDTLYIAEDGHALRRGEKIKLLRALAALDEKKERERLRNRALSLDFYGAQRIAKLIEKELP